ncbi:MAG: phosphatidylglycerophosphatase A [Gammaproteobacteria bacterium]|nr:phosphatidylglycerophosphatase A [Gammaproteobacteria bacterium]
MREPTVSDLRHPVDLLSLGLGSGLARHAPGTFGTLAATPFFLLLLQLPLWGYLLWLVVTFLLGIYLCGATAKRLKSHDHAAIVWDEFVGLWLTLLPLSLYPEPFVPAFWLWLGVGFVLFRFFDIVKPWPIRWLDRQVGGGFGIMVDDLLAGLLAMGVLFLLMQRW